MKVTEIEQLADAASVVPQLLAEIAKSLAFGPPTATPLIRSVAVPGFDSVTVWAVEVVPVVSLPKLRDVGESVACGTTGVVPVPLAATD